MSQKDTDSPIKDVTDTAIWVATYRARETARKDALFHDPLAGVLAGEKGESIARRMDQSAGTGWSVVIRTCLIDEYVTEAVAQGVDTIVNLGAGLDTRPYRMNVPERLHWIEADHPAIIAWKEERLRGQKPRCRLSRHAVDLANAEARRSFLADVDAAGRSILVLTEGVLPYLTNDQVSDLGRDLHAQAHVVFWIADFLSPKFTEFMKRRKKMMAQMRNAPFLFSPGDWRAFFANLGWRPEKVGYLLVEGHKRGRLPPSPWIWRALGRFLPAERKKEMAEMSGYALFRRA